MVVSGVFEVDTVRAVTQLLLTPCNHAGKTIAVASFRVQAGTGLGTPLTVLPKRPMRRGT